MAHGPTKKKVQIDGEKCVKILTLGEYKEYTKCSWIYHACHFSLGLKLF